MWKEVNLLSTNFSAKHTPSATLKKQNCVPLFSCNLVLSWFPGSSNCPLNGSEFKSYGTSKRYHIHVISSASKTYVRNYLFSQQPFCRKVRFIHTCMSTCFWLNLDVPISIRISEQLIENPFQIRQATVTRKIKTLLITS